jgi:hypothetical protein
MARLLTNAGSHRLASCLGVRYTTHHVAVRNLEFCGCGLGVLQVEARFTAFESASVYTCIISVITKNFTLKHSVNSMYHLFGIPFF